MERGGDDEEVDDHGQVLAAGMAGVTVASRRRGSVETSNSSLSGSVEYAAALRKTGQIDDKSNDWQMIRSALPGVFQHIKFLNGDEDLTLDSAMAKYFIMQLRIPNEMKAEWWRKNSETVRLAVNTRRANLQDSIKEAIMCECACRAGTSSEILCINLPSYHLFYRLEKVCVQKVN
jgi:hypothetical protein